MSLKTSFRMVVKTSLLTPAHSFHTSHFEEKREKACDEVNESDLWRLSEISGLWEQYYSTLKKLPKRYKKLAAFVVEALPAFKHKGVKFVLDLGCGAGRHAVCLAKNDFDAVGVDVSKSALRIAKEWLKKENLEEVALAQATMTSIPFKDNQFDAVISVSVIHHAIKKDIEATINEVYRILKRNGVLLANLASVEDPRCGKGKMVEAGTFRMLEAFEQKRFEELHHFLTKEQISKLFTRFSKTEIELLRKRPHYWKVMAVK